MAIVCADDLELIKNTGCIVFRPRRFLSVFLNARGWCVQLHGILLYSKGLTCQKKRVASRGHDYFVAARWQCWGFLPSVLPFLPVIDGFPVVLSPHM